MANYQCQSCGEVVRGQSGTPSPNGWGTCPSTPSGNHIWRKLERFIKKITNFL